MTTLTEKTKSDLQVIADRLASIDINVTIDITRENTPGEFASIFICKENYEKALTNLHAIRKMITSSYVLEVGYTNDAALFEVKPRFSYMLESERKQLGF